jgi:predicted GNAT family acetyltransferase
MRAEDLCFAPYWQRAFGEECRVVARGIPELTQRIRQQLGKDTRFVWEDGQPVSQAAFGHATPNGAVINAVYTPPHYRGRGYAASCVAELSQLLLDHGFKILRLVCRRRHRSTCGV